MKKRGIIIFVMLAAVIIVALAIFLAYLSQDSINVVITKEEMHVLRSRFQELEIDKRLIFSQYPETRYANSYFYTPLSALYAIRDDVEVPSNSVTYNIDEETNKFSTVYLPSKEKMWQNAFSFENAALIYEYNTEKELAKIFPDSFKKILYYGDVSSVKTDEILKTMAEENITTIIVFSPSRASNLLKKVDCNVITPYIPSLEIFNVDYHVKEDLASMLNSVNQGFLDTPYYLFKIKK